MEELEKLRKQRKELNEKIEKLEKIANDPTRILAERLHGSFCHWNHTDGCSWYYEQWEHVGKTDKRSKYEYFQKAQNVMTLAIKFNIKLPDFLEMVDEFLTVVKG